MTLISDGMTQTTNYIKEKQYLLPGIMLNSAPKPLKVKSRIEINGIFERSASTVCTYLLTRLPERNQKQFSLFLINIKNLNFFIGHLVIRKMKQF